MNWLRKIIHLDDAYEKLVEQNKHLRVMNADLSAQCLKLQDDFAKERDKLLDKMIALANPIAYSQLHPREKLEKKEIVPIPRPNFPGFSPSRLPPYPKHSVNSTSQSPEVDDEPSE